MLVYSTLVVQETMQWFGSVINVDLAAVSASMFE